MGVPREEALSTELNPQNLLRGKVWVDRVFYASGHASYPHDWCGVADWVGVGQKSLRGRKGNHLVRAARTTPLAVSLSNCFGKGLFGVELLRVWGSRGLRVWGCLRFSVVGLVWGLLVVEGLGLSRV